MNRYLKVAGYVGGGLVFAVAIGVIAVVAVPELAGGDDAYIVTSDSMTPAIDSGDVVVTRDVPETAIETGDVVTVTDGSGGQEGYVTHRVVDIIEEDGDRYLQLQGDANDQPDEGLVPVEYVQGTLHQHIPLVGYLLLFARSTLGLAVLVILPGLALVAAGSRQLLAEISSTGESDPETGEPSTNPASETNRGGDDR